MKHILHKRSAPGWSKGFETEDDARAKLLSHVCEDCLKGELALVGHDDKHTFPAPDKNSIFDLLGTPCGCEFEYEGAQQ